MPRIRYIPTNPYPQETWEEYRRELRLRRLQTTRQRRQLFRPQVNGFLQTIVIGISKKPRKDTE